MSDTDPPDTEPQGPSLRVSLERLARSVERQADASEGILDGVVEVQSSLRGAISGFAEQHGDRAAAELTTGLELRKIHSAIHELTVAVRQQGAFIDAALKKLSEQGTRLEAAELALMVHKDNGRAADS